eukprot:3562035-Alexandrium_andersonii.AAC.1
MHIAIIAPRETHGYDEQRAGGALCNEHAEIIPSSGSRGTARTPPCVHVRPSRSVCRLQLAAC